VCEYGTKGCEHPHKKVSEERKLVIEYNIPRRSRVDKMCPAELAIRKALAEVESMAADVRLTEAGNLLLKAMDKVADFVDGKN
jgi:hypothetical protein